MWAFQEQQVYMVTYYHHMILLDAHTPIFILTYIYFESFLVLIEEGAHEPVISPLTLYLKFQHSHFAV